MTEERLMQFMRSTALIPPIKPRKGKKKQTPIRTIYESVTGPLLTPTGRFFMGNYILNSLGNDNATDAVLGGNMADTVIVNGKKYFEECYLELANNNTKRAKTRISELEDECKTSALQAKMAIARQLELEAECERWAKESAEAIANWNTLKLQISQLEAQRDNALAANERDRTTLHRIIRQIDEEITGRMWLIEGRGCYEWNDDRYREEFAWAIRALGEKLEPLRKIASDLKDSPTTQAAVDAARS